MKKEIGDLMKQFIEKMRASILSIDLKMFLIILVTLIIPAIYGIVRINFLTNIPHEWGFNIASQLQWINISIEVLQEALIFPLFFLIGKTIKDSELTKKKIVSSLIVIFGIITVFSLVLGLGANGLTTFMQQEEALIPATVKYIRLELVAIVLANLVKFLIVILIEKTQYLKLIVVLIIQTILVIILDYVFINKLDLGVNSIAFTNIIVQASLLSYLLVSVFKMYDFKLNNLKSYVDFRCLKDWVKVGGLSGLESLIRNGVFAIMVIKIANEVGESGNFWITMNFLWGFILLPVLALADVIKYETSQSKKHIEKNYRGYIVITAFVVLLWLVAIPLYKPFMENAMGLNGDTLSKVHELALISIAFYIIFAFNNVIDSICYGIGKVDLLLYQSMIINILFYGVMFILYKTGTFIPTLNSLAIMMGTAMALDSIITFIMFKFYVKKEKLKIA